MTKVPPCVSFSFFFSAGYCRKESFLHKLPLFELGFAWVLPSVLFGAVAAVLPHRKEKAGKAEPACAGANGKQG